jgi:hypothetical protein
MKDRRDKFHKPAGIESSTKSADNLMPDFGNGGCYDHKWFPSLTWMTIVLVPASSVVSAPIGNVIF